MSPMSRPSKVDALKRGATATASPRVDSQLATPLPAVPPADHRPRREKPKRTRYTLDLDPGPHQFLKTYAQQIEADASEVMRALLAELQADPELATRVRARVWQEG